MTAYEAGSKVKRSAIKGFYAKINYLTGSLGKFYPFNLITEYVIEFMTPLLILRRIRGTNEWLRVLRMVIAPIRCRLAQNNSLMEHTHGD